MDAKTLHSLDSENDSKSRGSTTEPNNCMGDDSRVTSNKRKVSINYSESPRKRQRGASKPPEVAVETATARETNKKSRTEGKSPGKKQRGHKNNSGISEPTEVPVEDVTARGTKRNASTERETPCKKQRVGNYDTNTGEPTKVSVQEVRETERKKEVGAERPPATESPRTTRGDIDCEVSPSSCSPSTSQQSNERVRTSREKFEAKYLELFKLGQGGFGSVYAGKRKTDNLPVAIKHIPKADVETRPLVLNGKTYMVPLEVLLMVRVAGGPGSVGKYPAVSLLDWYDLDLEVLLVMERPVPSEDLLTYLDKNNGPLREDQAKNIMKQLVEAAVKMHSVGVFHRDIKTENILIELSSDVPRVRIIDFGCGCLVKNIPYRRYSGTSAYVPPEFYLHGTYEAGPSTVWQLGALLYELLDGYKHFSTSKFLLNDITINSELSHDCQDLLKVCLAVNHQKRATLEQILLHPWFS